jgi:hypothetical protein
MDRHGELTLERVVRVFYKCTGEEATVKINADLRSEV